MQYTLETEVFKELQDRRPIVIDPTLARAAQLADIHLLNEAKERGGGEVVELRRRSEVSRTDVLWTGGRFQQTPSKPSPVGEVFLCRISP